MNIFIQQQIILMSTLLAAASCLPTSYQKVKFLVGSDVKPRTPKLPALNRNSRSFGFSFPFPGFWPVEESVFLAPSFGAPLTVYDVQVERGHITPDYSNGLASYQKVKFLVGSDVKPRTPKLPALNRNSRSFGFSFPVPGFWPVEESVFLPPSFGAPLTVYDVQVERGHITPDYSNGLASYQKVKFLVGSDVKPRTPKLPALNRNSRSFGFSFPVPGFWPVEESVFLAPSFGPPLTVYDVQVESGHITPDYSNGLDYPDPLLLQGKDAHIAVKYLYGRGELFFHQIPHIRSLLRNQEERRRNGLAGNYLSSSRPGSPFYRHR